MLTLSQPKVEPLDATSLRDKLMVLTDGQGHYVAVDPEAPYGGNAFTGDGKMFAKIPATGSGETAASSGASPCGTPVCSTAATRRRAST